MSANSLARHSWFPPVALALLVILIYAKSFPVAFIRDDLHTARDNGLASDTDLVVIFTGDY